MTELLVIGAAVIFFALLWWITKDSDEKETYIRTPRRPPTKFVPPLTDTPKGQPKEGSNSVKSKSMGRGAT